MKNTLAMIALVLLLSACILVDDFGTAWKEAKPDICLSKMAESVYYTEFRRDPTDQKIENLARGWTKDGQNYLLLKKNESDVGGRLYRFTVVNGIFQRYRLSPTMRPTFEKEFPGAPVRIARDTVTLDALDTKTIPLLGEIAKRADYWEIEDQALYNTVLNPLCRFEDRDLEEVKNPKRKG